MPAYLIRFITTVPDHTRLSMIPETSQGLSRPKAFTNTAPLDWNESFSSYHRARHPSLNTSEVSAGRSIHPGPWASLPAHSCQGCQELEVPTTDLGHFWTLCLQETIGRAEVASCMPLTIKMVNSSSSVFLFCNTTHGMHWHSSRPTWVPCGIGRAWELGTNIMLVLLAVLWVIVICLWPRNLMSSVSIHETTRLSH